MSEQDKLVIEPETVAAQICADPAFAALEASGAPIVAAEGASPRVVYLNESARSVFGDDLDSASQRLLLGSEPGARRLRELLASARNGAAPRLERLGFSFGPIAEAVTILCRNLATEDRPLFAIAALGLRARQEPPPAPASNEAPIAEEAEGAAAGVNAKKRPYRFLWRTDATGKIIEATPSLAKIVGGRYGDLVGREFIETARKLRLDPEGRLEQALESRQSWSGLEVAWPRESGEARVPVTLGAFPIFDDARRFAGFQGYGLLHVDRAPPDARAAEPPPSPAAPAPEATSAKIVPLRPLASASRAEEAERKAESDALTLNERFAFDEIARALGAAEGEPSRNRARDIGGAQERNAGGGDAESRSDDAASAILRRAPDILDHLPVGVLVARDADALFANRTLLDYLGYEDLSALRADGGAARVFFGRRPRDVAVRKQGEAIAVRARDGESLAVDMRLQTIDWEDGPAALVTLRSVRPVAEDARQIARTQAELERGREEADELRATLDATPDAVAIIDSDGRLHRVNRAFRELFGDDPQQFAGASVASLFADADRAPVADYLRRCVSLASKTGEGLRVTARTRRGAFVPLQFTLARIGAPEAKKFCATLRDLGSLGCVDDRSEAARREAERASAAKSDFLAKVSHEIRTPLNAIIGFAEVMMEERFGPLGGGRYKEYLRDIRTSGEHALSLVNDLLDLSKIESGKMELDIERIDANAVIGECVSIIQPEANRSRVVIRLSLWPRLPRILADGRSLRQILLNLLSNAVKFNEAGGQVIVSSALTDAGFVVIRVKDTGIGMSESEVETALEPFRQVSASRKAGGTGLGLPVTKALIEANHASLSIKSRKNEGTLVEVAFPPPQVLAAE